MAKVVKRTKQTPELLATITRLAATGASNKEMIEALGISETTFYRWMEERPGVAQAIAKGRESIHSTEAAIAKLEQRKQWADEWIDSYIQRQGEVVETGTQNPDGTITVTTAGDAPPDWLIDRLIGPKTKAMSSYVGLNLDRPKSRSLSIR